MNRISTLLSCAVLGVALAFFTKDAAACTNDVDCPDPSCGGQVCKWSSSGHNCVAAGTDPAGTDGWCTVDSDCKCFGLGARCAAPHCTFTKPSDAPDAGADATTTDTGTSTDSSTTADTGTSTDAGTSTDSGSPPADSGTSTDTGSTTSDSGSPTVDSSTPADAARQGNEGGGGCSVVGAGSSTASAFGACAMLAVLTIATRRGARTRRRDR